MEKQVSEADVITKFPKAPVTVDQIAADLRKLGVEPGMTILVHSSLSALGWVCGGEVAVVDALMAVIRPFGNLIMPTHTSHLSDPSRWENPPVPRSWWPVIRQATPPFRPETTPSRGMGSIPELFRTMAEVVRSVHPHFSFAAWGERSIDLVNNHELNFGLGEGSPLARVYDMDGSVLLLGVDFDRNTSFHLAEHRAEYATKEMIYEMAPIMENGHRRWKRHRNINLDSSDFNDIGRDFCDSYSQHVRTGLVGNAFCRLFPQRIAVDYAREWIHRKRR